MTVLAVVDGVARELMLFAAAGLMVGGVDDLLLDCLFVAGLIRRRGERWTTLDELPSPPSEPRLAMLVPAWREAEVIGAMLRATLAAYDHRDYLVFVAAYPNDRATIDAVVRVAEGDARVRLVVNTRTGPTTKADNLNAAWTAVGREEAASGRPFDAVVLHDAEDVVHPAEPRVFAALLGRAEVVQLPVRPLVHAGGPLVSGHYLDEFAESHRKQMVVRAAIGAGMPLAGTGCAIAAATMRELAADNGRPFQDDSLVEDYELGLAVARMGGRGVFARVLDDRGEPVAVRAYFPHEFAAAARQKARWMTGIALAGWDRTGWSHARALGDHWMRMRDRRAPLAIVVLAAAYGAAIAWAVAAVLHAWRGEPVAAFAPAWLLAFNTGLLVWRLAVRVAFTARDGGWRQALVAPARFIVGNLIGLAAAPRALATYLPILAGRAPTWDKTRHEFPTDMGRMV